MSNLNVNMKPDNAKQSLGRQLRKAASQLFRGKKGDKSSGVQLEDTPTDSHPLPVANTTPDVSDNHPLPPSSQSAPAPEVISRKILAFRTNTYLISRMREKQEHQLPEDTQSQPSKGDRLILKVANAFATVAVIQHEIIAVVTNRSDKETLKVIVSSHPSHEDIYVHPSLAPPPPKVPNFKRSLNLKFLQFAVASNTRKDERVSLDPREPVITDVEILAGLQLENDKAIQAYAEELW